MRGKVFIFKNHRDLQNEFLFLEKETAKGKPHNIEFLFILSITKIEKGIPPWRRLKKRLLFVVLLILK